MKPVIGEALEPLHRLAMLQFAQQVMGAMENWNRL